VHFVDEKYYRRVYPNKAGLPVFYDAGLCCSFKSALDAHKEAIKSQRKALAQEMAEAAAQTVMPRSAPRPRRRRADHQQAAAE
jgi:hypothetical protein